MVCFEKYFCICLRHYKGVTEAYLDSSAWHSISSRATFVPRCFTYIYMYFENLNTCSNEVHCRFNKPKSFKAMPVLDHLQDCIAIETTQHSVNLQSAAKSD